ncbi:hypothetical protein RNI52_30560 [Labrys neptuniae]|nr:hypothetical protein [Labrys neptuniae]MDT3381706.1 hypothetical protein [Labrys neptuniae]
MPLTVLVVGLADTMRQSTPLAQMVAFMAAAAVAPAQPERSQVATAAAALSSSHIRELYNAHSVLIFFKPVPVMLAMISYLSLH